MAWSWTEDGNGERGYIVRRSRQGTENEDLDCTVRLFTFVTFATFATCATFVLLHGTLYSSSGRLVSKASRAASSDRQLALRPSTGAVPRPDSTRRAHTHPVPSVLRPPSSVLCPLSYRRQHVLGPGVPPCTSHEASASHAGETGRADSSTAPLRRRHHRRAGLAS